MQDVLNYNGFLYLQGPGAGTADTGGGGSGVQQVYNDQPTPDDPSLPALSFPTGGGQLTQWTGSAWV